MTKEDTDSPLTQEETGRAIIALARHMYLHYLNHNGESVSRPYPWSPAWALDYAKIAVEAYGFDLDGLDELERHVKVAAA